METPDLIVGLGHRKRVGKDTFAGMLESELEERGYRVFKIAFATPMKNYARKIFDSLGLRGPSYYEEYPKEKERPLRGTKLTPRKIWIEFANAMRDIDPDIWVRHVRLWIGGIAGYESEDGAWRPTAVIITDVRFPNEAEAIKAWGGKVAAIFRQDAPVASDPAETALECYPGWDWGVDNDGTLDQLAAKAKAFAEYLIYHKD